MTLAVSEVMTRDVVTAVPEMPYGALVELMATNRVSGVPVVDVDGSVLGVVTEEDLILKVAYAGSRRVREWTGLLNVYWNSFKKSDNWAALRADLQRAAGVTAREVMSSPALTITPDATVAAAASLMHTRHAKRLAVVDRAGRLVGIVSRGDLLKQFLRADERVEGDVRETVATASAADPIAVSVEHGVVTISGTTTYADRDRLLPMVSGVPGVVAVVDRTDPR